MEQKKKRGENWSSEEKEILRTLISQSAHIIENKSTKTSVNIQKIKEWKNITNKFNEITGKRRSDGELKLSWKRTKLCAKSNLYTYRRKQSKTGGGGKPPSPSLEDLEIMSIAPHDFIVEVNNYDSDAVDPVTVATTSKEVADPKPRLNFEKTDTAIVKNVENPEPNVVYVQGENCGCEKCKENDVGLLSQNAIGIYLDDQQALLRYDPEVKHSALFGLNLLSNIIASQRLPQIRDKTINIIYRYYEMYVFPYENIDPDLLLPYTSTEFALLFNFIITVSVINDVVLPCKERMTSTRHIHEMAGCPPKLYWLVTLTYHMACYFVFCCSGAIASFFIYMQRTFSNSIAMRAFIVVLLLCGLNFFLFAYVLSFFFNKRTTVIIILILTYFFGLYFPTLMIASDFLHVRPRKPAKFPWVLDNIGVVIPPYMSFRTLMRMFDSFQLYAYCTYIYKYGSCSYGGFYLELHCCSLRTPGTPYNPYDLPEFELGRSVIIVAVQILVNTTLILLLEYRKLSRLHHEIDKRRSAVMPRRKYKSSDVTDEKNNVTNTLRRSREIIQEKLLVSKLWKIYFSLFRKSTFALKDINYSVKKGECFALTGFIGSGITTHFKVITRQEYETKGQIFANGHDPHHYNAPLYAYSLGYCPQSYGLDYFRSGESNMIMLLRLRGLSNRKARNVTKSWFNIIGLKRHAKKAVCRYSMGMRRRLAIGCALCSGDVKLLDEPTVGVDVAAKHVVWAVIKRRLSDGDAVVLSSHNMEEVERLCDRLTILDSGEMGVLGSIKGIKNLYARGRTVFFKLRVSALNSAGTLRVQALKESMYREFSCFVNSEHLTTLWFTITEKLAFNVIFLKLRLLATKFDDIVEDYSAYDGNMEDAFIQFSHESRDTIKPQETW